MMTHEFKIPECQCPSCGYRFDAVTRAVGAHHDTPQPDDIAMCLNCGHVMAFAKNLSLRELSGREMISISREPVIIAMREVHAEMCTLSQKQFN